MPLPHNSGQVLKDFVQLHHARLPAPKSRCAAYLVKRPCNSPSLDDAILEYTQENIVNEFDASNSSVSKTLGQLQTYNPEKERVIGLIFGEDILSMVVPVDACNVTAF